MDVQSSGSTILSMTNVGMAFDGAVALRDVDFSLNRGEIRGLVGKNGAGKSTLIKILMGIHTPQEGQITLNGSELSIDESVKQREKYVSAIFQEFSLIPDLSVLQNVYFNAEPRIGPLIDDKRCLLLTQRFFDSIGITINPNVKVRDLNTAEMQLVEIAKAVSKDKKILIMDEPTAALEHAQKEKLFELMRRLKSNGVSIVFISHYLQDVVNICDSVSVLRDGVLVMSKAMNDTTVDEIVHHIVGEESSNLLQKRSTTFADYRTPLLEVDFGQDPILHEIPGITVYRGEVLGLAGLKGSGTERVLQEIFGVGGKSNVQIRLEGKTARIKSPAHAVSNGLSLIPENRQVQGVFLAQSVLFNITLPILRILSRFLFINDRAVRQRSLELIKRLQVKTSSPTLPAKSLSGGNQQKVVLAKAVSTDPRVILMDDPTFGVDVHAKSEIMKITSDFVKSGNGVIMVSSDYEELLLNCDRIIVIKDKTVVAEYRDVQERDMTLSELTLAIEA